MASGFDGNTRDKPSGVAGPSGNSSPEAGRSLRTRILVVSLPLLVIAAILLSLVLYTASRPSTSGGASHSSPAPTTTSTGNQATPKPEVVYQADWTHGANGWTMPAHWHLVDGYVENDGGGTEPLMVPYYVTSPDYTIEADLTVQNVPNTQGSPAYGIEGLNGGGQLQFIGDIDSIQTKIHHGFSELYLTHAEPGGQPISTQDAAITYATLTFAVQVQRDNVGFCIDANCLSNLNSTTPLWPMHIAIEDLGVQMTLTRLVITSP
ncbi:MAG: hypothetical protein ACLQUY_03240 [Ktedonobacterales bacterium]